MSQNRYRIRPKADEDLEEQALYYATKGSPELGRRFLAAAHDSFTLLASQPSMGWPARLRHQELKAMRVFRVKGFPMLLILYLPFEDRVEILRVVHGSRNLQALLLREAVD